MVILDVLVQSSPHFTVAETTDYMTTALGTEVSPKEQSWKVGVQNPTRRPPTPFRSHGLQTADYDLTH